MQEGKLKKKKKSKKSKSLAESKDEPPAEEKETKGDEISADTFTDKFKDFDKKFRKFDRYNNGPFHSDREGRYIDSYSDEYPESEHEQLYKHLDSLDHKARGSRRLHFEHIKEDGDYCDDDLDHFSGPTEDEWKLKETREKRNLEELQKKDE